MNYSASVIRLALNRKLRRGYAVAFVAMLLAFSVHGQSLRTPTDGHTPLGMEAGAPAGSFALSGFDNVNLFNGNLNFRLPLLQVGGRGAAQMTIMRPIELHWTVFHWTFPPFPPSQTPTESYIPLTTWWNPLPPGYGPGTLIGRRAVMSKDCGTPAGSRAKYLLTRLTFTAPDGTEYELRDQATGGMPVNVHAQACQGIIPPTGRGTVFVSADGSAMTFISDSVVLDNGPNIYFPTGHLLLRDGSRFRIEEGVIKWIRDRNGNRLEFTYDEFKQVIEIVDSMKRRVTITYWNPLQDIWFDEITYNGYGGAVRKIRVHYTNMRNVMRSGTAEGSSPYTIKKLNQLFPELNGADPQQDNDPWVISSIEIPDGRQYRFYYNSYAEVARVELPTGGAYEYDFPTTSGVVIVQTPHPDGFFTVEQHVVRRLLERRVYPDGHSLERRTVYSATESNGDTIVEVTHENSAGQVQERMKHYFKGTPNESFIRQAIGYPGWMDGREYKTESFNAAGTSMLRQGEHTFEQRAAVPWWSTWPEPGGGSLDEEPPNDVRLVESVSRLTDVTPNLVTKQAFTYDIYNNRTNIREYDFAQTNPPAFPSRRTRTDYLTTNVVNGISYNYATDPNIHLRGLPSKQFIYNVNPSTGAETEISKSEFEYDLYDTTTAGHALLTARANICGHESSLNPSLFNENYRTRGNVTETRRWLNTSGTWLKINNQYDIAGNVVTVVDARGKATQFDFQDRFGDPDGEAQANDQVIPELTGGLKTYAFPTSEINPLQHTTYTQYDYYIGRAVDAEDENGIISSGHYADLLDRPTQLIGADNIATLRHQTTFNYNDAARIVTTSTDQINYGDNLNKTAVVYDGLGREIEARDYETASAYIAKTQNYDAMGRVRQVSNPFRSGDTVLYTTTTYDTLGRVVLVTLPDQSTVSTTYEGNKTTVTDQAIKRRSVIKDGLGRIIKAIEDPDGVLNYETAYTYDAHDKLLTVKQGPVSQQQTRSYVYDSLGRLTQATIPEHVGSTFYQYDSNSNLSIVTDPRPGKSITFTYDDLNRVRTRNYSDTTPDVTFNYDAPTVTYSKGRLTSVVLSVAGNSYSYDEYDALGRIKQSTQTTDNNAYQMSYGYDLGGNMTSKTYPSGRVVSTTYDAADRISTVSGINPGDPAKTYVESTSYTAHGVIKTMQLGNGLWEHTDSNTRLQLKEIGLGTSATNSSKMKLELDYGTTTNNGNLLSQKIIIGSNTINQTYGYDAVNRLTQVQESFNTVNRWTQNYGYDRFGNRTSLTSSGSEGGSLPTQTTPAVNSLSNRLQSLSYDQAGNLLSDGSANSYSYDADNRLTGCTVAGVTSAYSYDGYGRRVKKQVGSTPNLITTIFVYDLDGMLIAEYSNPAEPPQGAGGTSFLTPDHLGSIRVVTDSNGNVKNRYDYMPFGELLNTGISSRSANDGYSQPFGVRNRFTGKERDSETGLDYFGARYYLGPHARFMGVDPLMESAELSLPQSWNRYNYVLNNPLTIIDPDGMGWVQIGGKVHWDERVNSQEDVDTYYPNSGAKYLRDGTIGIITSGPYAGWIGVLESGGIIKPIRPNRRPAVEEINFWAGKGQRFLAAYLQFAAENIITGVVVGKAFQALERLYEMAKAAKASKQTLEMLKGYCFVAGTTVVTSEGDKPIEELKEGDLVLASDPECGESDYRRVLQTIEREAPEVLDIKVGGTIITCTPEHPFWVQGRGWVEAADLVRGSRLVSKDGKEVCVDSISRRVGRRKVYNIEVEQLHTYFVSNLAILVHNSRCIISPVADDWAVKGAHIHVDGIELAVRPGMNGEIVFKSVFSKVNSAKLAAAIKTAQEALKNDSHFRQALLRSSRQAVEYLGKGATELARSRSGEINFLVKALEKLGTQ